jgi:hypothetical protein
MSISLELFRIRYSSKKVQFNQVQTVFEQELIVKFYTPSSVILWKKIGLEKPMCKWKNVINIGILMK